ncbi:uncharacterized protein LOC130821668 [Amaranthus tricolor]|uniref:uncharacterized protein LOC130821668 n=1 Tax=Amaranthus tricolor TaxID=29722 RepID=UPI00258E7771|nr:uncharacterized protein LOC130821668 [Amaranthus tricolor]
MVFIDLEKAYDSILQHVIWDSLKARGICSVYIEAIRDMYDRVSTNIQTPVGITELFPVKVGLHQNIVISYDLLLSLWVNHPETIPLSHRVQSGSVSRFNTYRVIGSVLNTSGIYINRLFTCMYENGQIVDGIKLLILVLIYPANP